MTDTNEATAEPGEDKIAILATTADTDTKAAAQSSSKKAPARKTPGRKGPTRKAAKKTSGTAKSVAARGPAPKYPRHSLEKALRIPRALIEQNAGKPATRDEAVRFAGGTGLNGPWSVEISSGQKYGFLTSENGTITLTDRARRAISPQSETDRQAALREGILEAPDFSSVYNYFRGEALPDEPYYANALRDRFKIPADKVPEFQQLFQESLDYADLLDRSGPQTRVLDVGRTDAQSGGGRAGPLVASKANVAPGASCFVMQPFSGALGSYYESIFKPAIAQAGLAPIRADADIFATGKIVDQIWRGINESAVLVAELTSKNPNVFYELGLAHALHKPVVLVSSNEEDVPFDLRHIRVIVYDQTDPFWGQKLIDKVADNIRSAVENPEDAIFHIDEVR
ncbi:hypothetical protein [Rhodococcus erythropolis]